MKKKYVAPKDCGHTSCHLLYPPIAVHEGKQIVRNIVINKHKARCFGRRNYLDKPFQKASKSSLAKRLGLV